MYILVSMDISNFYSHLPSKLLEETQKRIDRIHLVRDLHGRKTINESDIFTVFPFHTTGIELDEDTTLLYEHLNMKPPIGRQLQKCVEAWLADSLRYSQELGEDETAFPVLKLCRHWIGQVVAKRRCVSVVGRLYIEKFISLFAAKVARTANEISPRITVGEDDLRTAVRFISQELYDRLEAYEVPTAIFKESRFRRMFQKKKSRTAPAYLSQISQKIAHFICDYAIEHTKQGKMMKIATFDVALTKEPVLLTIAQEIGWNLAAPLDVSATWKRTPFISENIAFNGPRAYVIYKLAEKHDPKLAKKLVERPWNTRKAIRQLPAPTRDEVYAACKLAVEENKNLIDHLLLSNKRDMICCEKLLPVEGEMISNVFEQIRDELF
jgi:histone H3/H4